jgi:energy-converting hydrogenase B subunit D
VIQPLETIFLVLLVISAIAALQLKNLLSGVIAFGAFSFFAAMFYAIAGALDVAFTEAALGAVIATVFFVTAVQRSRQGNA